MDHPATTAAIDQVEHNAGEWIDEAIEAIRRVAQNCPEFTSDDVWDELGGCDTHEGRAMGPVMRKAAGMGICERTERTRNSSRPVCHNRPQRVWRSLLIEEFKLEN